jgi:hypothetical protein
MNKLFVLSNGVTVEMSSRKGNRSGYTGAALSPAWTLNNSKPFVAACANPTDPTIMSQLKAQQRTAWHGGSYADAREAAYVVALFKQDPVGTETILVDCNYQFDNFPADLYQLPVVVTAHQANNILAQARVTSSNTVNKTKIASTAKVNLNMTDVLAAVGVALKGKAKNHTLIRETLEAQFKFFRTVDDAVNLALEMIR